MLVRALIAIAGFAAVALAQSRETVVFSTNQTTVVGESIYVLGDLPELGAGDLTRALKLEPSQYPTWRLPVSLPTGRTYTYRYVKRTDSAATARVPTNGTTVAGPFNASTTPTNPATKAILYHSGWTAPQIWFRTDTAAAFSPVTMIDLGPGRGPTERRWAATNLPLAQRTIEFYITPSLGTGRDPASGTYSTQLDSALLQDGQLYNYMPAAAVGAAVRNYSTAALPFIDSIPSNLNERRFYRVWLPRGYSQHTTKRYPVLYLHDGQNCFEPGAFGTWNADIAANLQMARGAMREVIIVAADSNNNRFVNYVPSGDLTPSAQPGNANAYLRFMRDELKPVIDAQYRTLPDAANTGTMGSSMGGQVSMVFGWDATNTYTRIGALSNYWSTNFRNRVTSTAKPAIKLYMDSGDSGTASDNFTPTFNVRDALINNSRIGGPFLSELDFRHTIGFNQQHNEAAWAQRVGPAMSFLFPVTEEANAFVAFANGAQFDLTSDARATVEDAYRQVAESLRDVNLSGSVDTDDARAVANASRSTERTNLLR